ncbi:MAG TPA: lanthionine synthetase LanC family protein [Chryseosolibacter sp.]
MGLSLYHCYRGLQKNSAGGEAISLIERTLPTLGNDHRLDLSFGRGMTGVLWAVNHLMKNGFVDGCLQDCVEDHVFDELTRWAVQSLKKHNHDYLLGALGVIPLLIDLEDENWRISLKKVVTSLVGNAAAAEQGMLYWNQSPVLGHQGNNVINLGLAHGLPGILYLLAMCYDNKIEPALSLQTIERCHRWLRSKQLDETKHGFYFPFAFGGDQDTIPPSLRWCYGDLGLSIGLYNCGRLAGFKDAENYGLEIALHCARTEHKHAVVDAHLCHGTAGVAHIFARFFNYTGNESFKSASQYWFDQTCDKFDTTLESGFRTWKGDQFGWVEYKGFLEGSAGIGLALISSITDIEPRWDRCLLLS